MAKKITATTGIKDRLSEKEITENFKPDSTEKATIRYVKRRSEEMIDFRRGLGIEQKWREADEEYIPHELDFGTTRKRFETDQDSGLRSRMVPVGDVTQQWRQASSAPTLLQKLQTALGLIVDQMPEAELVALLKKYEKTTDLAYSLWKRNWSITDAREKLKLIVFDLAKYGWAVQRTFPRIVKYTKRILVEKDSENPENDRYEEKEITWFNDVDREPLSVYRTWIDELAKPYDQYSVNECYYEIDYPYDQAQTEFGHYANFKYVKRNSQLIRNNEQRKTNRQNPNEQMKKRKDIVTIGFFESRNKDLYCIYVPIGGITLYISPLPNDDGYLDLTQTLWLLRKSDLPYGVSLWEILRQNKVLYDKMKNMSMDQLVLSIMKFGFFSGTNTAIGDGKIEIVPGQARQLTNSTGKPEVNWMEIPGPGQDAWKGLEYLKQEIDEDTGISSVLEGESAPGNQTLGEVLHNREAALKRLKTPVENIAWLIDQDAYLTLSWMSQIYSIPTIKEFATEEELMEYEKENQVSHFELFGAKQEDGSITGPFSGHYLPQLSLHLEDSDGNLIKSNKSKFFQVGKEIDPKDLKWKGIFKTIPRSIIDSSQTLTNASKMEMFNILMPLFAQPAELVAKACEQIVKMHEEDPKVWLPDAFLDFLENGPAPAPAPGLPDLSGQPGAPNGTGTSSNPQSMQAGAGMQPKQSQTVVPGNASNSTPPAGTLGNAKLGIFNRRI